eukprot:GHVU01053282.1.p1 GENE.GHVU01053282.1~~GHVU01053282.1.p1  ORF type:complete len:446 (+),score=106.66 GHVU01053282.1:283-1620(+)
MQGASAPVWGVSASESGGLSHQQQKRDYVEDAKQIVRVRPAVRRKLLQLQQQQQQQMGGGGGGPEDTKFIAMEAAEVLSQPLSLCAELVSGGQTNRIVRVSAHTPDESAAAERTHQGCNDPGVLVRFYGTASATTVDRRREIEVSRLVARHGFGKPIVEEFEGGRVEEWLPGRSLSLAALRSSSALQRAVAAKMAQLHTCLHPAQLEGVCDTRDNEPLVIELVQDWLDCLSGLSAKEQRDSEEAKGAATGAVDFAALRTAFADMKTRIRSGHRRHPQYVIGHNDLLYGNILRLTDGSVTFIDFEYAGKSLAAFEIANFFLEFAGLECDYTLLPSRETRLEFIKVYLRSCREWAAAGQCSGGTTAQAPLASAATTGAGGTAAEAAAAEALLEEVEEIAPLSHLLWGLWALMMGAFRNDVDFDYLGFAKRRLAAMESPWGPPPPPPR